MDFNVGTFRNLIDGDTHLKLSVVKNVTCISRYNIVLFCNHFCYWLFSAVDLIRRLLKVNMNSRLSVTQAFHHRWIDEVTTHSSTVAVAMLVSHSLLAGGASVCIPLACVFAHTDLFCRALFYLV